CESVAGASRLNHWHGAGRRCENAIEALATSWSSGDVVRQGPGRSGLRSPNALEGVQSMNAETHLLEVATDHREAFVSCLALGTLEAMRGGSWPLEAGIWTLRRPVFFQSLASGGVAAEVVAELEASDELAALARLSGRPAADARLDQMIAAVRARLSA